MKRIQPHYFLIALLVLIVVAGVAIYSFRTLSLLKQGEPIEPPTDTEENDLFELWFTSADLFDVSIDRNVTRIIFGNDQKKVSLLDRDRKLLWEKSFPTYPLQTKISACGNYLAVGTEGGGLFFMSFDSQSWWQQELSDPVYLVELSANGKWVLIGRGAPEQETHYLELFNQDEIKHWSIPTGPLQKIYLSGEQLNRGKIFYSYQQDDTMVTAAASLTGEILWEIEDAALMAVSRTEDRLALVNENELMVYSAQGALLWRRALPAEFKTSTVLFNPQNNNLLVYGSDNRVDENLYCFNATGKIIWQKKIAEGALVSFTADGGQIITCSWRYYKEDFSQVVLYDESGTELSCWELGMRVERLLVAANRRYIVLVGEDGYIDVVDLEKTPAHEKETKEAAAPFYSSVLTRLQPDQTAITLFFFSDTGFVPVSRLISRTKTPLHAVIEELIRGPSRESCLLRMIPKEAAIEVLFNSESGQLYLELSPELAGISSSAQAKGVLNSFRYTVGCFPEVREIYLTVNQKPVELFGDGMVLEQPLKPYRWRDPLFIPVHIGERYYLVPREARDMQIEQRDLEGMLQAVVRLCRTLYFVPGDLTLLEATGNGDKVTINLNRSLCMLFPENGSTEEQLQAAMILDALYLTAVENSDCHRIEILVDGESWSPPQGYPLLSRTFLKPYYINPEF
ncbi:MAG: GerMN domain-containing protein [Dethiobacteria bacterium]